MDPDDLDKIIRKLHNPTANHAFSEECLFAVAQTARNIFFNQPMLLELAAPVSICGDIHGQYLDLIHLFDLNGVPPATNYLFLGDYVDRGNQSLECIVLLLCYKIKFPLNFFLLRGNHESSSLNRIYGFYDECKRRYSVKLWKIFSSCFNCMPIAAVVGGKIFCMHGGLSPELNHLVDILAIARPTEVPDEGLMCDLLWADPGNHFGWEENVRGVSYSFGSDIIDDFLRHHDLDLICRAHQVVEDGYEFKNDRTLVTIFTAPNYCGEYDNAAAILNVSADMMCSFSIMRPLTHKVREEYSSSKAEPVCEEVSQDKVADILAKIS